MRRQRVNLARKNPFGIIRVVSPIKFIIVIGIIFLGAAFIIGYFQRILKNSNYFRIKEIMVSENNIDLSYLKGQNIFEIDLQKESGYISRAYPTFRKIRLIRILPNRLFVSFIKRHPFAYVKLYRYFCVDEDLVLFDMPQQLEDPDLPLILGLETKIFGPKVATAYNVKELALALNIIKNAKTNKSLKGYKIKRIDVASLSSASFFITPASNYPRGKVTKEYPVLLEIKIGQDNIKEKINILSGLLGQVKNDWNNIKYIDLRFKEAVIRLKDVK